MKRVIGQAQYRREVVCVAMIGEEVQVGLASCWLQFGGLQQFAHRLQRVGSAIGADEQIEARG